MANPEHLAKLKEGVEEWNLSRQVEEVKALRNPNLSHADLSYADLSYADLSYVNLSHADLSYVNLSYVNLSGAILNRAILNGAIFTYADLSMANLSGADLTGANLSDANLFGVILEDIIYTASTSWPPGFNLLGTPEERQEPLAGQRSLLVFKTPIRRQDSTLSISFDPKLSPEQIKTALNALADYYRACGGVGFKIDFELQTVMDGEPEYAGR